jgi:hypothetical protein
MIVVSCGLIILDLLRIYYIDNFWRVYSNSYTVPHPSFVRAGALIWGTVKSRLENLQKRSKTCKCARKPKKSSNMEEIEDVLDDSGPLLYMGSVLSESCEEY